MNELDLCLTVDKDYFLAAISLADGLYTTAEDACAFETALAKVTRDIGRTGQIEIVNFEGFTTTILEHYGIKGNLVLDIELERLVISKPGFIMEQVVSYFNELNTPIENPYLIKGIEKLDAEIYRKSRYWADNAEPEYPFQATIGRTISVEENMKLKENYIVAIKPEVHAIPKPDMPIMVNVPTVSDIIRAYSENLVADDFIYTETFTSATNEFISPEEVEELYRLSTSSLYPDLETFISFGYFAKLLAPSPDALSMVELAMGSVYYRQNLKTIKANLGINNENLEYIVGKSAVSDKYNPNEIKLMRILENLMVGCLMYEYNFLSVGELKELGEIRSNLFDQYMLGFICRMLRDNYMYTGKAFNSTYSDDEEYDSDELSGDMGIDIYGYDRIVFNNGTYTLVKLSRDDLVTKREEIDLDGDRYIRNYLEDIVSSKAYLDMFIFMLRFGESKNRYIKISSKKEPKFPYFDTLLFKPVTVPIIDAEFQPIPAKYGKHYIIDGIVKLDHHFSEYNSPIGVPVGVVLRQTLSNGAIQKEKFFIIDAVSFYSTFARLREDKQPYYDIAGVDFDETGMVTLSEEVIISTCTKTYTCIDICNLLSEESEYATYVVETIPKLRRSINEVCSDAGAPAGSYSLFEAYKWVEEGKIPYKSMLSRAMIDNFESTELYIATKVAALQLPKLIEQSMSNSFATTPLYDIMASTIDAIVVTRVDTGNKFNELLSGNIKKYCKIINSAKEEIGYAFFCADSTGDYMLITSRREIGIRMPTAKNWVLLPVTSINQAIFKKFNEADDKEAFRQELIKKRYVFDTVSTFKYLQEDSDG